MGHVAQQPAGRMEVLRHGQSAVWAVPQLGSSASSARAWRLWAARHSQGEAGPLNTQPLPRVLKLTTSKPPVSPRLTIQVLRRACAA